MSEATYGDLVLSAVGNSDSSMCSTRRESVNAPPGIVVGIVAGNGSRSVFTSARVWIAVLAGFRSVERPMIVRIISWSFTDSTTFRWLNDRSVSFQDEVDSTHSSFIDAEDTNGKFIVLQMALIINRYPFVLLLKMRASTHSGIRSSDASHQRTTTARISRDSTVSSFSSRETLSLEDTNFHAAS